MRRRHPTTARSAAVGVLFAGLSALIAPAMAAPVRSKVAVLATQVKGPGPNAGAVTEAIRAAVARLERWDPGTPGELGVVLSEGEAQAMAACEEGSCLTELGASLGAEKVLTSTVVAGPASTLLTMRVVDARSAHVDARVAQQVAGGQEALTAAIGPAVKRLFATVPVAPLAPASLDLDLDLTAPGQLPAVPDAAPAAPSLGVYPLVAIGDVDKKVFARVRAVLRPRLEAMLGSAVIDLAPGAKPCGPADVACLAAAGKLADVDRVAQASIEQFDATHHAVRFSIITTQGATRREAKKSIAGDIEDLVSGVEALACELLDRAPCTGTVVVTTVVEGMQLLIDDRPSATLVSGAPLALDIGRHRLRVTRGPISSADKVTAVGYRRTTELAVAMSEQGPVIEDGALVVDPPVAVASSTPAVAPAAVPAPAAAPFALPADVGPTPTPGAETTTPAPGRTLTWVASAVTVLAAAGASVSGYQALSTFDGRPAAGAARATAESRVATTNLLWGVAGAGGLLTGVLFALEW